MKQKLHLWDEEDVVENRRSYKSLRRAGVASRIKRGLRRRARREGKPEVPSRECRPYYCPTADDYECCGIHGGFDVCCNAPELHWTLTPAQLSVMKMLGEQPWRR